MQPKIFASILLGAAFAAQHCQAQVVIPPGLEPGQIQQQLRQLRVPAPADESSLPSAPEQVAPPATDTLRFVLRDVQIDGATVYSPPELESAFAPLVGKEISVAQVFDVANKLTARYRRDGYILSQVLVPAQSIADGHVRLVAVEGYLAAVEYRGDVAMNAQLEGYSSALRRSRPLTAQVLERYLLLMNDLGQTTAYGTLVPSDTAGAANLVVDFVRHRQRKAFDANNRNSRSLGPWRMSTDLEFAGALSSWDAITLRLGRTADNELAYASLAYRGPFGARGAQWNIGATGVRARPGAAANLAVTDLKTESVSGQLQLSYPLLRSRNANLQARGALTMFDGQSELSLGTVSDDRLRAVRMGLALDLTDRWRGITIVDVEYSQGLTALGARQQGTAELPLSRLKGRADFSKATVYAARLQSLGGRWSALLAISAQQAFTTLLAPELFAFGGEQIGRGYDAAELAGDSGESVKVELRYFSTLSGWGTLTPYAFFDAGRVRRRDPINESARENASSLGAGLRWTGGDGKWNGFVELADPLDHAVAAEGNRDMRIFAGLRVNL